MPLSRRHALQALGLAAAGSTAIGKGWSKEAQQLRQELEVCSPSGDTFTWMLERNKVFSKAWQRSIQASNPQERIQIKQAIFDASCHIDPQALAQGQRPWAALLSCADARVAPEWMFGVGSGELFQVRVAGNSAFNDGIASLEFAVAALEVPLIVVMATAAAVPSPPPWARNRSHRCWRTWCSRSAHHCNPTTTSPKRFRATPATPPGSW